MAGKCKICGFQAGVFNLKNGVCKSCSGKSVEPTASNTQNDQTLSVKDGSNDAKNSFFSFEGRIRRSTFWATLIPLFLISFVIIFAIAQGADRGGPGGVAVLALIFYIPAVWVAFATYVKRWHDLGKSGWMVLTLFIPYINFLILLYLGLAPGVTEANEYGVVPK